MRALTTIPLTAGSLEVSDVPEPTPGEGDLLVDGVAVGVCGTDKEIAGGEYGWAPPGSERLVLGHESLGRVRDAPPDSGFAPGDLVVGVVRRPDPVPCGACAHGEFDMCRNGKYTERGAEYHSAGLAEVTTRTRPDVIIEATGAAALVFEALGWLSRLITRRVPLERFTEARTAGSDDIKVVLDLTI